MTVLQPDQGGRGDSHAASGSIPTLAHNPYLAARNSLERDGYVVLSASLFTSFDLKALRAAASRLTETARSGKWPHIRTLPKQFPPWPQDRKSVV